MLRPALGSRALCGAVGVAVLNTDVIVIVGVLRNLQARTKL